MPAKNDGMVTIRDVEARLSKSIIDYPVITEIDPMIELLKEMINTDSLMSYIQHLQDYGTRRSILLSLFMD
jgi:hypothetical protein